uniref:Uncharacterized protein n=1 Tax=Helianthus annuus TaxID=4232 RepID=A0A251VPX7_HELAN
MFEYHIYSKTRFDTCIFSRAPQQSSKGGCQPRLLKLLFFLLILFRLLFIQNNLFQ